MKYLVQFGSCVLLAALPTFHGPVQAQSGGWYGGGGGTGFWMTAYSPPMPLFGAYPGYCPPACSVPSPMMISTASYGADACCAPQCCNPCGSSCGTGCTSDSCAGCEPGTGSLKPNADENFRKKSPAQDSDAEDPPRDRDLNPDRDPDRRKWNESPGDDFNTSQPRRRTPGGSGSSGQSDEDFPATEGGRNLLEPPGTGGSPAGAESSRSGSNAPGTPPDADDRDGLFDSEPIIRTKRPPVTDPESDRTTDTPKSGPGAPAGEADDFAPSGTGGKRAGDAPTGDGKDFLPIEEPSGLEKDSPKAGFDADSSTSGQRIAGVASQLREVIPFTRLAVAGQGSAAGRLSDTTSARPASRWISVPLQAGHARL